MTDHKSKGFSIGLPRDWRFESDLRSLKNVLRASKVNGEQLESIATNLTLMLTADPQHTRAGLTAALVVTVEDIPVSSNLDEFVKDGIEVAKEITEGYQVWQDVATKVGGVDARFQRATYPLEISLPGAQGMLEELTLHVVDGDKGWSVACGALAPMTQQYLVECENIVRSFRLP